MRIILDKSFIGEIDLEERELGEGIKSTKFVNCTFKDLAFDRSLTHSTFENCTFNDLTFSCIIDNTVFDGCNFRKVRLDTVITDTVFDACILYNVAGGKYSSWTSSSIVNSNVDMASEGTRVDGLTIKGSHVLWNFEDSFFKDVSLEHSLVGFVFSDSVFEGINVTRSTLKFNGLGSKVFKLKLDNGTVTFRGKGLKISDIEAKSSEIGLTLEEHSSVSNLKGKMLEITGTVEESTFSYCTLKFSNMDTVFEKSSIENISLQKCNVLGSFSKAKLYNIEATGFFCPAVLEGVHVMFCDLPKNITGCSHRNVSYVESSIGDSVLTLKLNGSTDENSLMLERIFS